MMWDCSLPGVCASLLHMHSLAVFLYSSVMNERSLILLHLQLSCLHLLSHESFGYELFFFSLVTTLPYHLPVGASSLCIRKTCIQDTWSICFFTFSFYLWVCYYGVGLVFHLWVADSYWRLVAVASSGRLHESKFGRWTWSVKHWELFIRLYIQCVIILGVYTRYFPLIYRLPLIH